jgi:hypothetical protein
MKNRKNKFNTQPINKINFCFNILLISSFYCILQWVVLQNIDNLTVAKHSFFGLIVFSMYFYYIFHYCLLYFLKSCFISNNFKNNIKYILFRQSQLSLSYPLPSNENRTHQGFLSNVFRSPPLVWGKHFFAAGTTAILPGLGFSHVFSPAKLWWSTGLPVPLQAEYRQSAKVHFHEHNRASPFG